MRGRLRICMLFLLMSFFHLLFFLIEPVIVNATTFYVATTGDDVNPGSLSLPFKTIKKGLIVLQPGDALYLRGGTYPEGINSRTVTIPIGSSWANAPVISAYPGETVVLRPPGGTEVINLAYSYIQYVIFDGLVLDASQLQRSCSTGYGCSYGIGMTHGAHHVRFTNIEVKNAAGSGVLITRGTSGIATAVEFIGCDVHHNGVEARDHGFYLSTSRNLVRNCQVHHNSGSGVISYSSDRSVTVDNNTIDGNDIYRNGTMSGSAAGILVDSGSGTLVTNNIIRGNKNGIHVGTPSISTRTVDNTKVYNNTIYANVPGVGINIFISSAQAAIRNNVVYKNGGTVLNAGSSTTSTNNLLTDPRFVDELTGNFELQAGSLAIDQGIALDVVQHDFANKPRPQLTTHDIGAYEYGSGANNSPPSAPVNLVIR